MYIHNKMFEWDSKKAKLNIEKHEVSFELACSVFFDENAFDGPDINHSDIEPRSLRLGRSTDGSILIVAYTLRRNNYGETKIRIISARKASRKERKIYKPQD